MKHTVQGVDVAKRVFQLHWVEPETGEIIGKQIKRADLLEHFVNRARCVIGMEACGGAQHWARRLTQLGHQVKLMPGQVVKACVMGNKNDMADARAIWLAVQQPGVKAVAVKTEEQQAVLALHRMRQQLVKFRTMQSNGLRGLLTATAAGATMGNAKAFKSGREFAAWLGLAPGQCSRMRRSRVHGWNSLVSADRRMW